MKQFFNQLSNGVSALLSSIRPLAIAAICAVMLFANATPALAFGNSNSQPEKGLEQLDSIQRKSEEAISNGNKKNEIENVIKNSNEGLNGVQGAANRKDMIDGSEATGNTIEGNIKETLKEMTP